MLDSLVRVSRRVRGAADLLATEMRAVPVKTLAIRARLATRRAKSQERGAQAQVPNFTHALGRVPAVRRVKGQRSAAAENQDRHAASSRIAHATAKPTTA